MALLQIQPRKPKLKTWLIFKFPPYYIVYPIIIFKIMLEKLKNVHDSNLHGPEEALRFKRAKDKKRLTVSVHSK